jgi:hypothetical protein
VPGHRFSNSSTSLLHLLTPDGRARYSFDHSDQVVDCSTILDRIDGLREAW